MAVRSRASDGHVHNRCSRADVRVHGGTACAAHRPLHFFVRGDVQKARGEYAGADSAFRGRQEPPRRNPWRHREKIRHPHSDVRHERRLFALRHPQLGLRDACDSGRGERLRVQGTEAQGTARGLPLHRKPRHRRIRHLPQRLQVLLRQQKPAEGAGQLQATQPRLAAASGRASAHGRSNAGKPKVAPETGIVPAGTVQWRRIE